MDVKPDRATLEIKAALTELAVAKDIVRSGTARIDRAIRDTTLSDSEIADLSGYARSWVWRRRQTITPRPEDHS